MDDLIHKKISGTVFSWNLDTGELNYEGAHATLFWVETTLKSIFETLEELTGSDEIKVVMQTAGFWTGKIVGEDIYSKEQIEEIIRDLPRTYQVAGWGKISIDSLSVEEKIIRLKLENTWEVRLVLEQAKDDPIAERQNPLLCSFRTPKRIFIVRKGKLHNRGIDRRREVGSRSM
ncbi:hypothetical protein [Mesobacillus zeae]|uniref:Uncharacterized protein n=1 Tax=Mesobacillus zeae TaxID=1917180 RepID=A0A398B2Q9_9BACI|nr:hypothetical protein [Mesobacillus zeae]RID82240.1 hypothetical protein D1970_19610 [Mesobacillus zeae]